LIKRDASVTLKTGTTIESPIPILQAIVTGKYDSAAYFVAGQMPPLPTLQSPALPPTDDDYTLISLNAATDWSEFVSVETGGLVFEDPFWAVFAAHALSLKESVALPLANNNDELWKKIENVTEAVKQGTYQPSQFLGKTTDFVPPNSAPAFELITINSTKLSALRERGMQSFIAKTNLKFYELFQKPQA